MPNVVVRPLLKAKLTTAPVYIEILASEESVAKMWPNFQDRFKIIPMEVIEAEKIAS